MHNGHKTIGILAIQGDFAMHAKMLDRMARRGSSSSTRRT